MLCLALTKINVMTMLPCRRGDLFTLCTNSQQQIWIKKFGNGRTIILDPSYLTFCLFTICNFKFHVSCGRYSFIVSTSPTHVFVDCLCFVLLLCFILCFVLCFILCFVLCFIGPLLCRVVGVGRLWSPSIVRSHPTPVCRFLHFLVIVCH